LRFRWATATLTISPRIHGDRIARIGRFSAPAGRGTLTEGGFADIVMFDYDRIADTATFSAPHQYPKGIPYVIVNGQLVVDKGEHTGRRPGRVMYGPGSQAGKDRPQ